MLSDKFSRIQNIQWIKDLLQLPVQSPNGVTRRIRPPTLLRQSNSVFAGNYPSPPKYLIEKIIERAIDSFPHRWVIVIRDHDIDVDVAVSGMTKSCDRESVASLQVAGKVH